MSEQLDERLEAAIGTLEDKMGAVIMEYAQLVYKERATTARRSLELKEEWSAFAAERQRARLAEEARGRGDSAADAAPARALEVVPDAPSPAPESAPSEERHTIELNAEEEETRVWTAHSASHVQTGAEAGGAPRPPQATPRAALSVAVAPPASAPVLAPAAAIAAAGLGRPRSARPPHAPPVLTRTATLAGMPAVATPSARLLEDDLEERTSWPVLKQASGVGVSSRPPVSAEPPALAPRIPATLTSMPAQGAPSSRAPAVVTTKAVCGRCDGSGTVHDPGQGVLPCPACKGSRFVDTETRALSEAS
ncbi:MAG: hypothetical protein ABI134_35225 [Byssovorax sp.]